MNFSVTNEGIRNLNFDCTFEEINDTASELGCDSGELGCILMLSSNYEITPYTLKSISRLKFIGLRNKLMRFHPDKFNQLKKLYTGLFEDLKYFPVPRSSESKKWVNYINSWYYERTYGGNRRHEGVDIMAKNNTPGIYPVISATNGTVTNIGWLELGGYRIGITSENGLYYYYAHLDSYADGIKEGDSIKAGQLLGFMGNTGYSKVEGTKGKFDVHLHFGIYYKDEMTETALNPYYLLKILENKVLYYRYYV